MRWESWGIPWRWSCFNLGEWFSKFPKTSRLSVIPWRGFSIPGTALASSYEGIEAAAYLHELIIDNDDQGPYLRIRSNVWLAQEPAGAVDKEVPGVEQYNRLTKGDLWSSLVGYVRATPGVDKQNGATLLEGMTASPAGSATTWAGLIKGPQVQLVSDAIASTPTGPHIDELRLMGGLVEQDFFYAYDMAAFGSELRNYMSGRLSRVEAE